MHKVHKCNIYTSCAVMSCAICSYLDAIERALTNGDCVLIENMGESIDAVLDPLVGRNTIKKGRQGVMLLCAAVCQHAYIPPVSSNTLHCGSVSYTVRKYIHYNYTYYDYSYLCNQ